MGWQAISDRVLEVRRRWAGAPRVGPWSRHPRSIELLRRAQADIGALLAELDSTDGDIVGALCHDLAQAGAFRISIVALDPKAGTRGRYRVTWMSGSMFDAQKAADGWSPAVALRKAIRAERRAQGTDSDRLGVAQP